MRLALLSGDWIPLGLPDRARGLIGGLSSKSLVHIEFEGEGAREAARYDMGQRIREVEQGPAGEIYLLEDGKDGEGARLLKLVPKA